MSNDLAVVKKAIEQTNQQGQHLIQVVEHVEEIESNMNKQYLEIKDEFEYFRQTVTLQNSEIEEVSKLVREKTINLTIEFFEDETVSDELFSAKYVHLIMGVYQSLKDYFGITGSYKLIKHKDYSRAIECIKGITLHHLRPYYLRMTDHQKSLKEETQ